MKNKEGAFLNYLLKLKRIILNITLHIVSADADSSKFNNKSILNKNPFLAVIFDSLNFEKCTLKDRI